MKAQPIVAITSDPTNPFLLTLTLLLIQKGNSNDQQFFLHKPEGDNEGSVASCAVFSECFWKRWKQEYLQTQKSGRKWQRDQISLKNGDIVLLRDPESQRHNWPLVIVENAIPGKDGGRRVRKVQIRASGNGVSKTYRRPVTF